MDNPNTRYKVRAGLYSAGARWDGRLKKHLPLKAYGKGIEDTWTDTMVSPIRGGVVPYKRLRELNELPAVTTQKVHALLRKAGQSISKWHRSGQIRGWGHWSSGAAVEYDDFGVIHVNHVMGNWGKMTDAQIADRAQAYAKPLQEAGITVHFNEAKTGFTV